LRDSETELLFKDVSRPLIKAAASIRAVSRSSCANDPEINAFVDRGQTVYLQSASSWPLTMSTRSRA
jgi:predicted Zn-dependent protease